MKTYFMNDINEDICQNCTEVKCLLAEVASVGKQNECLTEEIKQMRVKINDLLEALIEVVRISDRKHDAWDKAKAAIAKATGK